MVLLSNFKFRDQIHTMSNVIDIKNSIHKNNKMTANDYILITNFNRNKYLNSCCESNRNRISSLFLTLLGWFYSF